MAPPIRSAGSLNKLMFGLVYFLVLAAWNWVCSHHYHVQAQASAVRSVVAADATVRVASAASAAAQLSSRVRAAGVTSASVAATKAAAAANVVPAVARPAAAAATAAATTTTTTAVATAAAATPACPKRRPFHTLLTAQATIYQQWQSRIMHYHWKKQRALDGPCTDMTGFTRLVASERGQADGLEDEMPSVFVRQYTTAEIAKYGHFGVLNRPFSVVQLIERGGLSRITEDYIYIAETDHVLMRPLPNLATEDKAAAFGFGYMHAGMWHQSLITKFAPGTSYSQVQPVGPSPLIIRKDTLATLAPSWLNLSLRLKLDADADRRFGWVLEMWGYSIAAAAAGVRHEVLQEFQAEGGAGISAEGARNRGTYIFHYTYGIEYTMRGRPQGPNQIGEWSLDKRHYGAAYPPRKLQPPPVGASDGAQWLLDAFNEASAAIPTWPATKALGTVGWRREEGDGIRSSELAQKVLGTRWTWAGIKGMAFEAGGKLTTPWGSGKWGCLPQDVDYNDGGLCKGGCLFADFGSAMHNLRFSFDKTPWTFDSYRLGDGEHVPGVQQE